MNEVTELDHPGGNFYTVYNSHLIKCSQIC